MFMKILPCALAAVSLSAATSTAQELKLADFHAPIHFVADSVHKPFAEAVAASTNGQVTVKLFMGGELGPGPNEQYSRAVDGVADIVLAMPGYTASNFPVTLLADLPGIIDPENGTERIIGNLDKLADEYRRVQLLALWNNAPSLLFTSSRPIRTLDDLSGMKIRVPSRNAGLVLEAWGGVPISMPASEVYNAMQTGVIDGAMIDTTALVGFRLAEVTNYITAGMDTAVSQFMMVMNRDSFQQLSEDHKEAVLSAGREAALNGQKAWGTVATTALEEFIDTNGKELIQLSDDEIAKFNAISTEVVAKIIAEVEASSPAARSYVEALTND